MAFNFALGLLPDSSVGDLAALGTMTDGSASFDSITLGSPAIGVGQVGPHVVLVDPDTYRLYEVLPQLTANRGGQAQLFIFSGVSDTYVLQSYGPQPRLNVRVMGEQVEDDGSPLAAEAEVASSTVDEEDRLALMFEKVSGRSMTEVFDADYRLVEIDR